MRKTISAIILLIVFTISFTGCGNKAETAVTPESPVTVSQVNTEGKYAARAFLESIFSDDRDLFNRCYPEGFVDRLGAASNTDIFEEYKKITAINIDITGTAYAGSKDYTLNNGFDEAGTRSRICMVTGLEYSSVGKIQIQKVRVFFRNANEIANSDFYYIVYQSNGSWYVFESFTGDAGF